MKNILTYLYVLSMPVMKKITTLVLFSVLLVVSCKKRKEDEKDKRPTPTQTGRNILWCKVNGSVHEYNTLSTWNSPDGVFAAIHYFFKDKGFSISAGSSEYNDYMLFIVLPRSEDTMQVKLQVGQAYNIVNHSEQNSYYRIGSYNAYQSDTGRSALVFSRFDENIVSGTFEFHGYNSATKDSIHLTEGFFDILRQ